LKLNGDRVGILEEIQNRARRLRAPFVGVLMETGDSWERIGFCGVFGIDWELCRRGRGLIGLGIIAAEKSAETASLSSSAGAIFLFLSLVEWVIAMVSTY
jgi:hypothetical protein